MPPFIYGIVYHNIIPYPISSSNHDCNDTWNDDLLYYLGWQQVWHDHHGEWIPDEDRHHPDENGLDNWYDYCDYHNIRWDYPRFLPHWAIEYMDNLYRDEYYQSLNEEN